MTLEARISSLAGAIGADIKSILTTLATMASVPLYKTANYTAQAGDTILADVSGGSFTITLPEAPQPGDTVTIIDYLGIFGTAVVTVSGNGSTIAGNSAEVTLRFPKKEYAFVYINNTWQVYTKDALQGVFGPVYLTGPTTANEMTDITLELIGWSAVETYTISTTGGVALVNSSSIRWTLPSVDQDTIHELTVVSSSAQYTHAVNVVHIPTQVDTSISITDFTIKDNSTGWSI